LYVFTANFQAEEIFFETLEMGERREAGFLDTMGSSYSKLEVVQHPTDWSTNVYWVRGTRIQGAISETGFVGKKPEKDTETEKEQEEQAEVNVVWRWLRRHRHEMT
jgi:hypothetical protein